MKMNILVILFWVMLIIGMLAGTIGGALISMGSSVGWIGVTIMGINAPIIFILLRILDKERAVLDER